MTQPSLYRRIMGGNGPAWAGPVRWSLGVLERFYAVAIARRNAYYDREGPRYVAPIPTVSVGNLTVGGTGKTPLVINLVHQLGRMGFRPAVVSRGYRGRDGMANDETQLIRKSCPGVVCLSDPDRAVACESACSVFEADVIVLDDGFQHRSVARSLDIVLIDATLPFGYDHLLPRGLLREPVSSLGRAEVIVLTRCDQAAASEIALVEHRVHEVAPRAVLLHCRHRVTTVERLDGSPLPPSPAGQRVWLLAAIGQPDAFEATAKSLGFDVVGRRFFADHHSYRREDIAKLLELRRAIPFDYLLTTEKDAVKLAAAGGYESAPILVVRTAIDFLHDDATLFQRVVEQTLNRGS